MSHGFSVDRKLMALAEQGATVKSAARSLDVSVKSIQKKARPVGNIDPRRTSQQAAVRLVELGLKAKK